VFLPPGSTLLLYTDGLVSSASLSVAEGLAKLQRAGASAPAALEDLCEHVLSYGIAGPRRDDDISLLAARLGRTSNEERATTGLGGGSP
jgi:serine phosphatase RsbU (regulator of sigma subunit)